MNDHLSSFQDVLPTFAELLGQPVPESVDGISFLPSLKGELNAQKKHDYLYWEFCTGPDQKIASQAVRQGPWKAFKKAGQSMELYNLTDDPFETKDLAPTLPEKVSQMETIIQDAHVPLPSQKQ